MNKHNERAELMRLADEYARAEAKAQLESLYGTSKSYTRECTREAHEAREKFAAMLEAQPAEELLKLHELGWRRFACPVCGSDGAVAENAAQPAEQAKGQEAVADQNKYAEFWERLPGHLIDHHEGDILTEELLQRAAADLYAKFQDFVASGLKPFGLLLLEERATTRQLVRALREATDPPTFMGEPITTPPAQPAREYDSNDIPAILKKQAS